MKHYIATNGEVIEPVTYGVDVYDGDTKVHSASDNIPIEERFSPEFVTTLREYDPVAEPNPPEREPPVPAPMTGDQATAHKAGLIAYATTIIDPLADAVELGIANSTETAKLTAWKKYRVDLSRIDAAPDSVWPDAPEV